MKTNKYVRAGKEAISMAIKINAPEDIFRGLRESGAYYVDKTMMLKEYLEEQDEKAVLFTRPRRFGKTMTMTMFRDFLDIRRDSRDIFQGLEIMKYEDTVAAYMNQYPVIFMSLKEIYGSSFKEVYEYLQVAVANLCASFGELLLSDKIIDTDKNRFRELGSQSANEANTITFLDFLSRILHIHYGKQVFIIIDEYDVPMARTYGTPAYDKTRALIERMLSYVCKSNDNVKAVMLSGCLYTVKNSAYTGVNNIKAYTVLSPLYAASFGFTDEEVRKLLEDAELTDHYETVKEWYDGYLFGRDKIYCPWDVLCYVASVLQGGFDEDQGPESYWVNTSETSLDLIHGFFGKTAEVNQSFEQLLAGNTIDCIVEDAIPYHRIHENGDNLWSALVETGYLTKAVKGKPALMPLRIPNKGIYKVFLTEVWSYFRDKVDNAFVRDLTSALWAGESRRAEDALNQVLEAVLSFYHEYHEYSYHLILDGFFTGLGYRVLSEQETGYGRSDLIILDPARSRCLLLEFKHVKEKSEMEAALKEAGSQIINKKYESRLVYQGYSKRIQYAMAFCDKFSRIVKIYQIN